MDLGNRDEVVEAKTPGLNLGQQVLYRAAELRQRRRRPRRSIVDVLWLLLHWATLLYLLLELWL